MLLSRSTLGIIICLFIGAVIYANKIAAPTLIVNGLHPSYVIYRVKNIFYKNIERKLSIYAGMSANISSVNFYEIVFHEASTLPGFVVVAFAKTRHASPVLKEFIELDTQCIHKPHAFGCVLANEHGAPVGYIEVRVPQLAKYSSLVLFGFFEKQVVPMVRSLLLEVKLFVAELDPNPVNKPELL